jgi:hypothetical protein
MRATEVMRSMFAAVKAGLGRTRALHVGTIMTSDSICGDEDAAVDAVILLMDVPRCWADPDRLRRQGDWNQQPHSIDAALGRSLRRREEKGGGGQ